MQHLTASQRTRLRSLAHHLDALVYIGKQGLTESVIQATQEALVDHELIKVKFNDFKDQKRELTALLAEATQSAQVGLIGNIATLYRQHPDPEQRKIDIGS
jgi:RNA-binding protein